jgi:hypothetical protein
MMLQARVVEMVQLAAKLKDQRKDLSEASTKASFVQPILEALGWKVTDPDEVVLEYPVYGGTRLDYALLVDGRPALYLEAKPLRASMDEPNFIAQTVSYANNDGIRWCVLTNGLIYRIYKSDTLAPADQKLLAQADIREASDSFGAARVAATLAYLSKESLTTGKLDEWGERVFVDTAVRRALGSLLLEGSHGLVMLVRKTLDEAHTPKEIKESLHRLGADSPQGLKVKKDGEPVRDPASVAKPSASGEKLTYDLEHHTQGKPEAIVDLFGRLDQRLIALGPDVERVFLKRYISYKVKRSFATLRLDKGHLVLYVAMPFAEAPKPEGLGMRDVSSLGHQGLGDTEVSICTERDIAGAEVVARASFERSVVG